MALPLLDTNVLLRHFTGDHEVQSPRASALIKRIGDGELQAQISNQVIFEAAFTLQKVYRVPRERIVEALKEVLDLDGLVLNGKDRWPPVFDLFTSSPRLSFVDCYHVVYMQRYELNEILTWDREFDRVAGITRIEP